MDGLRRFIDIIRALRRLNVLLHLSQCRRKPFRFGTSRGIDEDVLATVAAVVACVEFGMQLKADGQQQIDGTGHVGNGGSDFGIAQADLSKLGRGGIAIIAVCLTLCCRIENELSHDCYRIHNGVMVGRRRDGSFKGLLEFQRRFMTRMIVVDRWQWPWGSHGRQITTTTAR